MQYLVAVWAIYFVTANFWRLLTMACLITGGWMLSNVLVQAAIEVGERRSPRPP